MYLQAVAHQQVCQFTLQTVELAAELTMCLPRESSSTIHCGHVY